MGVDKDESGKNAASQLKHFRNLIDETASKAKFLAGFQRADSNAEAHRRTRLRTRSSSSSSSAVPVADGGEHSSDGEQAEKLGPGIKPEPEQQAAVLPEGIKPELGDAALEQQAKHDESAAAGPSGIL